jgi:cysteinyl-tRNA synthetase
MSKSLGNLVTIKDFLARHDGDVMRMFVLNGSYRAPLTFTDEVVLSAEQGLERIKSGLRPASSSATGASPEALTALTAQAEATRQAFVEAMDDDFNTSGGLAALFELVRAINTARDAGTTDAELKPTQDTLRELTGVLGLRLAEKKSGGDVDGFVDLLVEVRLELRKRKLWALSDLVRDRLKELGVIIEDSKDGTTWRWG